MPFAMNEPFSVAEKSTRRGRENGGSKVDSLDRSKWLQEFVWRIKLVIFR